MYEPYKCDPVIVPPLIVVPEIVPFVTESPALVHVPITCPCAFFTVSVPFALFAPPNVSEDPDMFEPVMFPENFAFFASMLPSRRILKFWFAVTTPSRVILLALILAPSCERLMADTTPVLAT